MRVGILFVTNYYDGIDVRFQFNGVGGSAIYDGDWFGFMGECGAGASA